MKIEEAAWQAYGQLNKAGKPREGEHTCLAAVILEDQEKGSVIPVALGTGLKSLPRHKKEEHIGEVVADCHAEVIARRCFVAWLADRAANLLAGIEDCPFLETIDGSLLSLRANYTCCLYTSMPPCGLLGESARNPLEGRLRTRRKPGRGEESASASCSDKVVKWAAVGLQGASLSLVLAHPVRIASVVIGRCWNEEGEAARALSSRILDLATQRAAPLASVPRIGEAAGCPPIGKPCPCSVGWALGVGALAPIDGRTGRKLGSTKCQVASGCSVSALCKRELAGKLARAVQAAGRGREVRRYGELKGLKAQSYRLAVECLSCSPSPLEGIGRWHSRHCDILLPPPLRKAPRSE